jgi:hypothetical protein
MAHTPRENVPSKLPPEIVLMPIADIRPPVGANKGLELNIQTMRAFSEKSPSVTFRSDDAEMNQSTCCVDCTQNTACNCNIWNSYVSYAYACCCC